MCERKLVITRFYTPECTFGKMSMPDGVELTTIERPWLNNQKSISCIPIGQYICQPSYYYGGGYDAPQVLDVPGRTHILFHIGNWVRNTKGCILVCTDHAYSKNGPWGTSSTNAFKKFMKFYGSETFKLTIQNYQGGVTYNES